MDEYWGALIGLGNQMERDYQKQTDDYYKAQERNRSRTMRCRPATT